MLSFPRNTGRPVPGQGPDEASAAPLLGRVGKCCVLREVILLQCPVRCPGRFILSVGDFMELLLRGPQYDQVWVTSASSLDVDHMLPLAEAWDSGAAAWSAARREAYANDQGAPNSLIAVSGSSNRAKADRDPADWLPVPADRCTYAADWVADKLRWRLTADPAERDTLSRLAEACPTAVVSYEQVP